MCEINSKQVVCQKGGEWIVCTGMLQQTTVRPLGESETRHRVVLPERNAKKNFQTRCQLILSFSSNWISVRKSHKNRKKCRQTQFPETFFK